jgi:glutamine amidotransferase-like uncharacterized protein
VKAKIQSFVRSGGRYLGFCMGGYFAGKTPGFEILPGDSNQYIASSHASVTTADDTIINVLWRDKPRVLFFQDGPLFTLDVGAKDVTVLATYASNGQIAALVAPFGKGKVGVVGPHPEAPSAWYQAASLTDPDGHTNDLARDLINSVMP